MVKLEGKKYLLLWLAFPVLFGLLHQFFRDDQEYLGILVKGMVLYVLFFSVLVHELCHGLAAFSCGDDTAREAHRLTLNPVRHVSVVGTILVPLILYLVNAHFMVGWAKGVPFNPANFRRYPRDAAFMAISGPLSNFVLSALCFGLYLVFGLIFNFLFPENILTFHLDFLSPVDVGQASFSSFWFVLFNVLCAGMFINLILGMFNLIPFPPLDGSWLLKVLLPRKAAGFFSKLQLAGFLLLIAALHFGLLDILMYPAISSILFLKFLADLVLIG